MSAIPVVILLDPHLEEVDIFSRFIYSIANKNDIYSDYIKFLDQFGTAAKKDLQLLPLGLFTVQFLGSFLVGYRTEQRFSDGVMSIVLNELVKNNIITKSSFNTNFYGVNSALVKFLQKGDRLRSVILGSIYMFNKLEQSIFKVVVETSSGESAGTGFLLKYGNENKLHQFLITNKHVVDGNNIIKIINSKSKELSFSKIIIDPLVDLACIKIEDDVSESGLFANERINIGSDVFTIGFPSLPGIDLVSPVMHSGEINGIVQSYLVKENDFILYSAKTAAGNSGSPLFDMTGSVIGIVAQDFFDPDAFVSKGTLPYYAAIPFSKIREFLNNQCL